MNARWRDHNGKLWPVLQTVHKLKFYQPSHAALRAFVFHRDGYACKRCPAKVVVVPVEYDGRATLFTDSLTGGGFGDVLIVDHKLTRKAGGKHHPRNLQALCETCNRRKIQSEDKPAIARFRRRAG
jgi:5-methylcytosine-specific restriction endonuclease McrA